MDEAKRKQLEELRKQIDPKVLERVAKAMNAGPTGAAGAGSSPPAPSRSKGKLSGRVSGGSMSDLKARIVRREKEWLRWEEEQEDLARAEAEKKAEPQEPDEPALQEHLVVFDTHMLHGRVLSSYLKRMEFTRFSYAGDPHRLLDAYMTMMNNPQIKHPGIVTSPEGAQIVRALINSEPVVKLRSELPNLGYTSTFVLYEHDRELSLLQGVDPRYIINMRHDPSFNRKRIRQMLEFTPSK